MRRAIPFLLVMAILLAALRPTGALSVEPRLAVFEALLSSGCGMCRNSAPAIIQLATDYAGRAIVVEQNAYDTQVNRHDRYVAAVPDPGISKPWVMVDSGHEYTAGLPEPGFYQRYAEMVDAELARPPQAAIQAYSSRIGDAMHVYMQVQNLSTATLAAATNDATATAIVYQDVTAGDPIYPDHPEWGTFLTTQFVRAVTSVPLATPLAPAGTQPFTLNSTSFAGYDWSTLHVVAFVDYRPGGLTGAYDMLQAVVPTVDGMTLSPSQLQFAIDSAIGSTWSGTVQPGGPTFLSWAAVSDQPWLTAAPTPLVPPAQVAVQVDLTGYAAGQYTGHVTYTATAPDGVVLQKVLTVSGSYGTTDTNCYALTLDHSGDGSDPAALPAASDGCEAGTYRVGAAVGLTAGPAVNWEVAGWSGTAADASVATVNSLSMPAAAHAASVSYTFRPECTAPSAPAVVGPQAGTVLDTALPAFTWQAATGADAYHLQVCTDVDCRTVLLDATAAGTDYAAGQPLVDGAYYWSVSAIEKSSGCLSEGATSTPVRFYVCVPPEAAVLLLPADGASTTATTPTFTWAAVAAADEYEVQVDGSAYAAFVGEYVPSQALAGGAHTWRVRAHSSSGGCSSYGPWSEERTLTIESAPSPTATPDVTPEPTPDPTPYVFTYLPLLQ